MRIEVVFIWVVLLALIAYFNQDKEEGSHLSITLNEDQTVEMRLDGEVIEPVSLTDLTRDHEIPMQLDIIFGYPTEDVMTSRTNVMTYHTIIRGPDK